ncbi:MAG: PKD domain-containing protein [Planctomycetes bacterium]|nr:PKD domain-containing protein [Planctomycetota bacterium]
MQRSRSIVLTALVTPLLLMQVDLSGCLPISATGGTTSTANAFNLPPTVVISADLVRGIAPLTVRFSSVGSSDDGLIVARLWNFADGQTSQDISPSHTFANTGVYAVALRLTDDRGAQSTRRLTIYVTEAPVARISVDHRTAESAPAIFTFDASQSYDPDGEIEEYQWDFGDSSRELLPVVTHTYATSGTYRARLTVTDNNGVTGTAEVVIEVGIRTPEIAFRTPPATITNIVCSNDSPLWVYTVFEVEPNVPRTISAGLDGDDDPCNAQAVLFDAATGARVRTLAGHTDRVLDAVFSADSTMVLTASDDRTLRLYDTATGQHVETYGGNLGSITSAAFSPDGATLVFGEDTGAVILRNVSSGAIVRQFVGHTSTVNAVAFSPDGTQILSGSDDRSALLWNVADGTIIRTLTGHAFGVTSVAFSPTDATLVLTGSVDQAAKLWDTNNGTVLVSYEPVRDGDQLVSGHANSISDVAFSPDGTMILTGSDDRTAKLWSVAGGPELRTLSGHGDRVTSVGFSPDGTQVVTGSEDATALIWDATTGEPVMSSLRPVRVVDAGGNLQATSDTCTSAVSSVAFSPSGAYILAGVAARNDIKLDSSTRPAGNDLNLTVPTPLDLTNVDIGEYYLWAEIDTDRTAPSRTYSGALVNVIAPFTESVDNFTPRVPLRNDRASVIVAPTDDRQIFDLGTMSKGDRLYISLLSTPGYGDFYDDDEYSLLIMDADEKVFAWYQDNGVFFTPDAKLVIGHSSTHYYVVIDRGHSVNLHVQRGGTLTPRTQRIYLNFDGAQNVSVAGEPPVDIGAFDASDIRTGWGAPETTIIKNKIEETVKAMYADWPNIVISTSDDAGAPPDRPYQTVYFGSSSLFFLGIADYIDPRNDTLTGSAIVATDTFDYDYPTLTAEEMGFAIGATAVHESGHLLGLRHTDLAGDVMSYSTSATDTTQGFRNDAPLTASEQYNAQIGYQDARTLFDEIFGTD